MQTIFLKFDTELSTSNLVVFVWKSYFKQLMHLWYCLIHNHLELLFFIVDNFLK